MPRAEARQESCREVCVHGPGYHWLGAGLPNTPKSWIYQIPQLSLPLPLLFFEWAREHSACKPQCLAFHFVVKALFVWENIAVSAWELYFSKTFSNIYTSRTLTDSAASFTYGAKGWLATDCYFDKNTFCLGTILKFIFQVLLQIHVIKCLYVHLGAWLWYRCKKGKKNPPHNWCLFSYLKCQNGFAALSPWGCSKPTLTTQGMLLKCPCAPQPPAHFCGARIHRVAQEIQKQSGSVTLRMWKEMFPWQ